MTRLLVRLFEAPEVEFRGLIDDWEKKTGRNSVDISLTNKLMHQSKEILKYINLDDNASEREVYHALNDVIANENDKIKNELKIDDSSTPTDVLKKIIKFINGKDVAGQSFYLKPTKAREFIKKHPPKKIMKALGYRSVDSLLKREPYGLIINLAKGREGVEWNREYARFCNNLVGSDFSLHDITITLVSDKTANKMTDSGFSRSYLVRNCPELGAIFLLPPQRRFKLDAITCLVAVVDAVYQTRQYGSYFNFQSFQKDFGKKISSVIAHGIRPGSADEFSVMWPAAWHHIARTNVDDPLVLESKIDKPSDIVVAHFGLSLPWHKFEYLAYGKENPVSLNLLDAVTNASNDVRFENRFLHTLQQEVWDKLSSEYIEKGLKVKE